MVEDNAPEISFGIFMIKGEGEKGRERERERGGEARKHVCVCFSIVLFSCYHHSMYDHYACSISETHNTIPHTHTHTDPAPAILPMGYNLVKHVLDEKTRKKIHFLGSELHKLELKLSW